MSFATELVYDVYDGVTILLFQLHTYDLLSVNSLRDFEIQNLLELSQNFITFY